MHQVLIVFQFILLSVTIGFSQDTPDNLEAQGPQMTLAEKSFHFGEIEEGKAAIHVFKFENTGTDTLRIEKVHGS